MAVKEKIRIRLRSYDHQLVDSERALLACLELAFSRPAPAEGRSILDTALRLPGRAGPLRHIHVTPTGLEGGAP